MWNIFVHKKNHVLTQMISLYKILGFMVTSLIFDKNFTVYIKVTKIGIDMKLMKFKFHVLFLIFASILLYLYPGFPTAKLKKNTMKSFYIAVLRKN